MCPILSEVNASKGLQFLELSVKRRDVGAPGEEKSRPAFCSARHGHPRQGRAAFGAAPNLPHFPVKNRGQMASGDIPHRKNEFNGSFLS